MSGHIRALILMVVILFLPAHSDDEDDGVEEPDEGTRARGKRPVFECFWNGRLIPYTKIDT